MIQCPRKAGGPKAASHKPAAPGVHCAPQGAFLYILPLWVATTLGWIVFTTLSASHIHSFSVICAKQKLLPLCDKEKPGPRKWHTKVTWTHIQTSHSAPLFSHCAPESLCLLPFPIGKINDFLIILGFERDKNKTKCFIHLQIYQSLTYCCLVGTQVGVHRSTGYYVSAKTKLIPMNYNLSYY